MRHIGFAGQFPTSNCSLPHLIEFLMISHSFVSEDSDEQKHHISNSTYEYMIII